MTEYLCMDGPMAGQMADIGEGEGFVLRGGILDGTVYRLDDGKLYCQNNPGTDLSGQFKLVDKKEEEIVATQKKAPNVLLFDILLGAFLPAWFVMLGAGVLGWHWSYWVAWFVENAVMVPISLAACSVVRYAVRESRK